MSKEVQVDENPFDGFNFLDGPVPKEVTKKTKEDKPKKTEEAVVDDLSPEEIEALNKTAEKIAKATKKSENTEEEDIIDPITDALEDTKVVIEDKTSEADEGTFKPFLAHMASKGILDYDESEEIEDSEEGLEKVVAKTVQNGISSYKQSFPEDAQKFLEFVEQGGKPADFHKYYYSEASFEEFTIDTEENQKYVIEESLKLEGYTDEEIQDEINDLVDLGKLEKKASTHLNKLKKVEKENKQMLIEAQKQYAKEQEALRAQEWEKFEKGLFEKETIAGFKLTPKMKQDLWDYMTKPVNKKTGETQYHRDSKDNEDARYMFAYLLKNKWDVKSLEQQVETKTVSKLKAKLANYTDTRQKISKSPANKLEPEDNSNPFAAFKNLK